MNFPQKKKQRKCYESTFPATLGLGFRPTFPADPQKNGGTSDGYLEISDSPDIDDGFSRNPGIRRNTRKCLRKSALGLQQGETKRGPGEACYDAERYKANQGVVRLDELQAVRNGKMAALRGTA